MVICDMIYFHIRYAHLRRISFFIVTPLPLSLSVYRIIMIIIIAKPNENSTIIKKLQFCTKDQFSP
jgi:hypothetical protein